MIGEEGAGWRKWTCQGEGSCGDLGRGLSFEETVWEWGMSIGNSDWTWNDGVSWGGRGSEQEAEAIL